MSDPTPDRRVYYRHARTGDRGYLVKRQGADHVKYDRVGPDQTVPFRSQDWVEEIGRRSFHAHEMAHVAFEADRQLCRVLGLQREASREWIGLTDSERIRFISEGPRAKPGSLRARLFASVLEAMKSDG